jgi:hypothetical protein
MTTIAWPTLLVPSEQEWGLTSNTLESRSSLNQSVQTKEFPGARWYANLTFNGLGSDRYREFMAFLAKLRGRANRVALTDYGYTGARGALGGTPIVDGAGQYPGASLNVSGFPNSVTNVMRAGDYFQVGTELKLITQDINSDGTGDATLVFEPPLRAAPTNGASIITTAPAALMMLADDGFSIRTPSGVRDAHYIVLSFEEAFS